MEFSKIYEERVKAIAKSDSFLKKRKLILANKGKLNYSNGQYKRRKKNAQKSENEVQTHVKVYLPQSYEDLDGKIENSLLTNVYLGLYDNFYKKNNNSLDDVQLLNPKMKDYKLIQENLLYLVKMKDITEEQSLIYLSEVKLGDKWDNLISHNVKFLELGFFTQKKLDFKRNIVRDTEVVDVSTDDNTPADTTKLLSLVPSAPAKSIPPLEKVNRVSNTENKDDSDEDKIYSDEDVDEESLPPSPATLMDKMNI